MKLCDVKNLPLDEEKAQMIVEINNPNTAQLQKSIQKLLQNS